MLSKQSKDQGKSKSKSSSSSSGSHKSETEAKTIQKIKADEHASAKGALSSSSSSSIGAGFEDEPLTLSTIIKTESKNIQNNLKNKKKLSMIPSNEHDERAVEQAFKSIFEATSKSAEPVNENKVSEKSDSEDSDKLNETLKAVDKTEPVEESKVKPEEKSKDVIQHDQTVVEPSAVQKTKSIEAKSADAIQSILNQIKDENMEEEPKKSEPKPEEVKEQETGMMVEKSEEKTLIEANESIETRAEVVTDVKMVQQTVESADMVTDDVATAAETDKSELTMQTEEAYVEEKKETIEATEVKKKNEFMDVDIEESNESLMKEVVEIEVRKIASMEIDEKHAELEEKKRIENEIKVRKLNSSYFKDILLHISVYFFY